MNFNFMYVPHVLALGSLAGFTIYLGIPFALIRSRTLRTFANSLSVGVLFFILVEILKKAFDSVEDEVMGVGLARHEWGGALLFLLVLVAGIAGAYLGLVWFERVWLGKRGEGRSPVALALIIASGIGLHNFSEGLAIGQELAQGALALGMLLGIGFALHNATEGFGIAAPLTGERPSLRLLFLLGLVGGGPTVLGALLGQSFKHPALETFFLALASGAIFYVIGELTHLAKQKGSSVTVALGVLLGLFLAFGSDLVVAGAQAAHHNSLVRSALSLLSAF